jgi:sec-independent protein translocase protein TatB
MFNIGGGELLVIMLIALIVLGPQRLPDAARTVGRVVGDLRRISSGFQQELKDAFDTNDVDRKDTPRRKESVPLAATVAEADERAADEADSGDTRDDATDAASPVPSADPGEAPVDEPAGGSGDTVAPAVAAALDEIVAPLPPRASTSSPAPDNHGEDVADDPVDRGDGLGDERAAS